MVAVAYRLLGFLVWRGHGRRPLGSRAYRLLGIVVWQGGKWYVRRHIPSRRLTLLAVSATSALLGLCARILRRATA